MFLLSERLSRHEMRVSQQKINGELGCFDTGHGLAITLTTPKYVGADHYFNFKHPLVLGTIHRYGAVDRCNVVALLTELLHVTAHIGRRATGAEHFEVGLEVAQQKFGNHR